MSEVRITVGPANYAIRCGPGEEAKVARLGALIDEHYAKLGSARTTSEAHNVVFAALLVADALEEAQAEIARLRENGASDRAGPLATQLEALAERAEQMAEVAERAALEGGAPTA